MSRGLRWPTQFHKRNGHIQDTRHSATHCYWLERYTGVVSVNRSAGICCASCSAVQPVFVRRSCAKSVENSSHHSNTQSRKANSSGGLQADFNNAHPFAVSRKVHRANVHLPSIATAISRTVYCYFSAYPSFYFLVFLFLHIFSCRFRAVD